MTHGDQAKAKAAKSSQASGFQKSSSKDAGKAVQSGKGGKGSSKEGSEGGKAAQIVLKKQQAGTEAAGAKGGTAETGNGSKAKNRSSAAAADPDTGFSNPAVANAFKRALKKYPNAFRRLTD